MAGKFPLNDRERFVFERLEMQRGRFSELLVTHGPHHLVLRVVLTPQGERVFEGEFPRQIAYLKKRFDGLTKAELKEAEQVLRRLREIF